MKQAEILITFVSANISWGDILTSLATVDLHVILRRGILMREGLWWEERLFTRRRDIFMALKSLRADISGGENLM